MSTTSVEHDNSPSPAETTESAWGNDAGGDDFNYTPYSPWGPVAMTLGLASLLGLTNSIFGLGLAGLSSIVGIAAFFRIRAASGAFKGGGMAIAGAVMSVCCLVGGSVKLKYDFEHEVPAGYLRVSFPDEISDRRFIYYGNQRRLDPAVAELVGKKVFLKGFMWNVYKSDGLQEFMFLKDNGECCFGGEPKPYDMMMVHLKPDNTTPAFTGMISVSGTLQADPFAEKGEAVYTVEADIVEEALTPF